MSRRSQKAHWDNHAVVETAKEEGATEKAYGIASEMKKDGHSPSMIAKYTGLTEEQIKAIKCS